MTVDPVARLAALEQALAALEAVVSDTQQRLEHARAELAALADEAHGARPATATVEPAASVVGRAR